VAAGFFDINVLGDMTSVGTLAAFAIVCLSVIYLRRPRPICRAASRCRSIRCCRC
jgi:APA family basic amino acid/polyamine antiporter